MARGNPKPKITEAFLAQQKPKYGDRALPSPIPVRFPVEVDEQLRALDDRQKFIREAVAAALAGEAPTEAAPTTDDFKPRLEALINQVLMQIQPRDRATAGKFYKKLLSQAK